MIHKTTIRQSLHIQEFLKVSALNAIGLVQPILDRLAVNSGYLRGCNYSGAAVLVIIALLLTSIPVSVCVLTAFLRWRGWSRSATGLLGLAIGILSVMSWLIVARGLSTSLSLFKATAANGGNCNCHLIVEVADDRESSCRLYRKNQSQKDQAVWCSIFKTVDGQRQYLFPERSSDESISGQLRLLRIGNQMHYMYAAGDSDSFRIVGTQDVGTDPTVAGQIQLAVETEKNGSTSAVWKRLTIRGQKLVPESAIPFTVAELNQQRYQMLVTLDHDFTKDQASEVDSRRFGQAVFTEPQTEGLKLVAPGSNNWTASGLLLRSSQPANCDVYMDIQPVRMDTPTASNETSLIFQTEFDAPQKPTVELKYYCEPDGSKDVRVQTRRFDHDGRSEWKIHAKADVTALASLRTARRGESVYFLYREKDDSEWMLLTGVHIGPGAVVPDGLRLLLHTGGPDRESQV